MPKYRDYFRQMLDENEELFTSFAEVHQKYTTDRTKHQAEFNKVGEPVATLVMEWEQKLCGTSERGNYAKYSAKLAEKFRSEVKAFFPMIDFIGLKVVKPATREVKPAPIATKPTPPKDKDLAQIDAMDMDDFDIPKLF